MYKLCERRTAVYTFYVSPAKERQLLVHFHGVHPDEQTTSDLHVPSVVRQYFRACVGDELVGRCASRAERWRVKQKLTLAKEEVARLNLASIRRFGQDKKNEGNRG